MSSPISKPKGCSPECFPPQLLDFGNEASLHRRDGRPPLNAPALRIWGVGSSDPARCAITLIALICLLIFQNTPEQKRELLDAATPLQRWGGFLQVVRYRTPGGHGAGPANTTLLTLSRQFMRDLLSRHVVDRVDFTAQFQGNQAIWLKLAPSVALPPS